MNGRALAADILEKVLEGDGQSHRLLQEAFRSSVPDRRDRRFLTRLVKGTVEQTPFLDARLSQISKTPVGKMKPYVRTVLRMSLYQLWFMEGVPASAAVNEAVRLVRGRGMAGLAPFVNGVLRTAARKDDWAEVSEAARLRLPEPLYRRLVRELGQEGAREAAQAFLAPQPFTVRVNRSRSDPEEVRRLAAQEGWDAVPSEVPDVLVLTPRGEEEEAPESLMILEKGLVQPQDPSAALALLAPEIRPGDRILDLCAAPGGKTLHAADRLAVAERGLPDERKGSVLARDLTEQKRRLIEENVRRSGLSGIRTETGDAAVYEPSFEGAFDLVIADLPCSGLGVIGRKPEIRFRAGEDGIRVLAKIQRGILAQAVRYVKPGGQLLYATCTLTEEENRENAARIASLPDYEPADFAARLPGLFAKEVREGQLTVLPAAGRSGFFISLFRRKAEPEERRR